MALDPVRQQIVGADMERIFGSSTASNTARELEDAPWASPPRVDRRRNWRALGLIALPLVGFVLLAAALISLGRGPRALPRPAASRSAPPIVPSPVASAPATRPSPVAVAPVGAPSRGVGNHAADDAAERASGPQAERSPAAPLERTVPHHGAVPPARPAPRPAASTAHTRGAGSALVAPVTGRRDVSSREPVVLPPQAGCERGDADKDCIYEDMIAADRRLRHAYAAAIQNGATSEQLSAVRRDWRKARDVSSRKPEEMIRRFDRLTEELKFLDAGAHR